MPKAPSRKTEAGQRQKRKKIRPPSSNCGRMEELLGAQLDPPDNPNNEPRRNGYRDPEIAELTLHWISNRSLQYQVHTVNQVHTAARIRNANQAAAKEIYRDWLDNTYPQIKAALRKGGWRPVLSRDCVRRYLARIEANESIDEDAKKFARKYIRSDKRRKLAFELWDDNDDAGPDMDRVRYDALCGLVSEEKEKASGWTREELWQGGEQKVTDQHLSLIAWAWSPVGEKKLP